MQLPRSPSSSAPDWAVSWTMPISELRKSGADDLQEGDKVVFDTELGPKGVRAVNIKVT